MRSGAWRLLWLLAAVVLTPPTVVVVLWPLTPTAGSAEVRVAQRLALHASQDPHALPSPDKVGRAVIATEDSRFFRHRGLDTLGVARALIGFAHGRADPGGATLEQQLAKNLYTPGRHGLVPKVEQAELAFKLDRSWSKPQVLEMYLAAVYFGAGHYGLPAAARGYFGRAPADLTWGQASLLAGLLQAPSAYDPYRHPERARRRQRHVLDRLVATGSLTSLEADRAAAAPWALRR
ncbi:MAG: putative Transglycosylase [Frankiales bacterium]|nr:putative Transglycosylase [Frankiales bacterium]